jgi:hypothetical protein
MDITSELEWDMNNCSLQIPAINSEMFNTRWSCNEVIPFLSADSKQLKDCVGALLLGQVPGSIYDKETDSDN